MLSFYETKQFNQDPMESWPHLWKEAIYKGTSENWPHGQFSKVSW